jgi:hypothetical protein
MISQPYGIKVPSRRNPSFELFKRRIFAIPSAFDRRFGNILPRALRCKRKYFILEGLVGEGRIRPMDSRLARKLKFRKLLRFRIACYAPRGIDAPAVIDGPSRFASERGKTRFDAARRLGSHPCILYARG